MPGTSGGLDGIIGTQPYIIDNAVDGLKIRIRVRTLVVTDNALARSKFVSR